MKPAQRRIVLRWARLALLGSALVLLALTLRGCETIVIPHDDYSLSPTYGPGAKLLVRHIDPDDALERGTDVVYLTHPEEGTRAQFGRVRALPGDVVGSEDGYLTVNGEPIGPWPVPGHAMGKVPERRVCILAVSGRADVAPDSRVLGFIPREDVKAIIRNEIP